MILHDEFGGEPSRDVGCDAGVVALDELDLAARHHALVLREPGGHRGVEHGAGVGVEPVYEYTTPIRSGGSSAVAPAGGQCEHPGQHRNKYLPQMRHGGPPNSI